jgi:hypothetical protein
MKIKKLTFIMTIACISCVKTIHIDLQQQEPKLVIDGTIESGLPPYLFLSHSLNFFSTINKEELEKSYVHDALVTVSDGQTIDTLREYNYTDSSGFTYYLYTTDTTGLNFDLLEFDTTTLKKNFIGRFNTNYTLTVKTKEGHSYTAKTSIPYNAKTCDSIWWKPAKEKRKPWCTMYGRYIDPPALGNYTRYFTRRNGERFLPGLISVFDDGIVNGTTYTEQFLMGWDKNSLDSANAADINKFGYALRGDTVTLKYCNIDKSTFTFWNTWEYGLQSYTNPFAAPVTVIGNVSNGALGAFCGYATAYKTIIIPE